MALSNQYLGTTQNVGGGTFLLTKSFLNISEGIQYGNTIEYLNNGKFVVQKISKSNFYNPILEIEAEEPLSELKRTNDLFTRSFDSHINYLDNFNDQNLFSSNWASESGEWGLTQNLLRSTFVYSLAPNNQPEYINYVQFKPIKNLRATIKVKSNIAGSRMGIQIRKSNNGQDYALIFNQDNRLFLQTFKNGSNITSTTATLGATPSVNTYQWIMVSAYESRYDISHSLNGVSFTKYLSVSEYSNDAGFCALTGYEFATGNTLVTDYDSFEFVEIGNQYTAEDLVKSALDMGGIYNYNIQADVSGFTFFIPNTGTSFYLGNSDNAFLISSASGNSWHTAFLFGKTLSDFRADFEFKAGLSTLFGSAVGVCNTFYLNYHLFGTSNPQNDIEAYINNERFTYNKRGDYINLRSDIWYKGSLVKSDNFLGWYINNQLVNSFYGNSLALGTSTAGISFATSIANIDNQSFGFAIFRSAGIIGSTVELRNFRISSIDTLVSSFQLQQNQTLESFFRRILPNGFVANLDNDSYDIFELGQSRSNITIGNSNSTINYTEDINYSQGIMYSFLDAGENRSRLSFTNNVIKRKFADSVLASFEKDESLGNNFDINKYVTNKFLNENSNIDVLNLSIPLRPSLEIYDNINYINPSIGISRKYIASSVNKSFDFTRGDFRQDIRLILNNSDI